MNQPMPAATPCESLWFTDGSVILRAPPKMFRVYKGILSSQSMVFRDLFTIPQAENVESIEGVPVVDLQDDSDDLTYFLRALNDTCFYDSHLQDFHVIAGILRLSTKYDVSRLRYRAIVHLLSVYPMSFEQFSSKQDDARIQTFDGMEVAVINLGENLDVPQILPAAYYKLLKHSPQILLEGVQNPNLPNSGREFLCPKAIARYAMGQQAMQQALMGDIYGCIIGRCPYEMGACIYGRTDLIQQIWVEMNNRTLGPFHGQDENGGLMDVSGLCGNCQKNMKSTFARRQREAWENLPGWFDLPDWDKLIGHVFE